ncbi:MAG TPA: hypothetical protein VFA75_11500 [Nevskia sp.]|nr:hypothetical protein [Nevskia sp.]
MSGSSIFRRTFYIRFSGERLRVDAMGLSPGFDDLAVVAIGKDERGVARVTAIGQAAECLQASGTVLVRPFANPRTVLDDYTVASKLLCHAVRQCLLPHGWTAMRPMVRVLLHPLREFSGGLTQVEMRALLELAQSAGARLAAVHEGRELQPQEVEAYRFTS